MTQEQKDQQLKDLKAQAYDLIALREQATAKFQQVNQEIIKVSQEKVEEKKEEPKKE